jgi:hypothetical protein
MRHVGVISAAPAWSWNHSFLDVKLGRIADLDAARRETLEEFIKEERAPSV